MSIAPMFPDYPDYMPGGCVRKDIVFGAGETKTDTMYCTKSELCRARFCLSHPTCTITKVERIQLLPAPKYRIYYHYNPKYVFRGETGPDFCTDSCTNPSGQNSKLCEAWEKTVLLKRAGADLTKPDPPADPGAGTDWNKIMKYGGIGIAVVAGLIITITVIAMVAKSKKKKR